MNTTPLLLIRHADVYAPEALGIHDLLIGGGKLLAMAAKLPDLPAAWQATIVDAEGRRLLPGLVDGHVHVTGGGGESGHASRVPAPLLGRYTQAGVTTVIGLLGTDDTVRSTAQVVAQLYALREEGLSAWGYCGGYHLPPATVTGSVRSDIALIEPLIGVGELAISDHRSSQPTYDELLRIAADAHVAGLMTGKAGIVHLHLGDGLRGLELVRRALAESELPARVFNPTHVNRRKGLFDEALAIAHEGCHIDITAFPVEEGEDAWAADDALLRALDAGVKPERLSISSDAGGCLPCFDADGRVCKMDVGHSGALLDTLNALLSRGLSLAEALPAFTRNPAMLLRLPGKGRIAVGADADVLLLNDAGAVDSLWAGGIAHVRGGKRLRHGTFEN